MSVSAESGSNVVLHGVRWESYERLLEDLQDHGPRLTFAQRDLEIMSPSRPHEILRRRLARAVDGLTSILDVPLQSGGAMCFRRESLQMGFEPDECWWFQNEARMREVRSYDPATDPPPDLVLEVEVSRSALGKLRLFAAFGVGEVWRYDGERLVVQVLRADGDYEVRSNSRCLPFLPMDEFAAHIASGFGSNETTWIRSFGDWVHNRLGPGAASH